MTVVYKCGVSHVVTVVFLTVECQIMTGVERECIML